MEKFYGVLRYLSISVLIASYMNGSHVHATWSDVKEFRAADVNIRVPSRYVALVDSMRGTEGTRPKGELNKHPTPSTMVE